MRAPPGISEERYAATGNIKSLRHVQRYLTPYRARIAAALIALVFTSGAVLALGQALRFLIDQGLHHGDPHLLDRAYGAFLGVIALLAGATYVRFYLVSWVGERVIADLRRDVYRRLTAMDITFFETTRVGELLSRLTTDTTLLQTVIGSSVSIALRNGLLLMGGFLFMLITDVRLTGYVLLIVPVVVGPILFLGTKVRKLSRQSQSRIADISAHAEESLGGIRTLQALALEESDAKRFDAQVTGALDTALSRIRMRAVLTALVISFVFGAMVTVLWIGGHDVLKGTLSPGALSAFVLYAVITAGSVGALGEVMGDLQRAAGATERIVELLNLSPGIAAPDHPTPLPRDWKGRVGFEQVTFTYPSRPQRPALENISLTLEPGETVALVGPSGAGKTTLFQLLLRFYDPGSGRVTLDGIDLRTLDPRALRAGIALVPQEPLIFSGTAWENIRCGREEATDEEVLAAAKDAAALEFLEKLPDGLGSFLGEKGMRLSGGQKQRIAIARAFVRGARLLLLDEATSSLDAENERLVQDAMSRLMRGRTTLIIAHRLATVMKADRIVVMNEGNIEAIGTHATLLESSPLYARLASLQFNLSEGAA